MSGIATISEHPSAPVFGLAQRMDVMSKITMTAAPNTIAQLGI
jgi:hypothetical protein